MTFSIGANIMSGFAITVLNTTTIYLSVNHRARVERVDQYCHVLFQLALILKMLVKSVEANADRRNQKSSRTDLLIGMLVMQCNLSKTMPNCS